MKDPQITEWDVNFEQFTPKWMRNSIGIIWLW